LGRIGVPLDVLGRIGVPLDEMVVDKEEKEGGTSTSLMLIRDGRIIQKYCMKER
jgi:hypothetical protein